jgi:hypothetical protein
MYLSENISEKWKPVMEHGDLPEIKDSYKRDVTLRLLENQEKFLQEAAPTNSGVAPAGSNIDGWDPILISLVRRSMPQMIAYDVCGVQPMTGPTGLIFAMKSQYVRNGVRSEALFNESETDFSGNAGGNSNANSTQTGLTDTVNPFGAEAGITNHVSGEGMTTANAEALGDVEASNAFAEMAFSIDKISVTARSRALKAEYSTELAQDLKQFTVWTLKQNWQISSQLKSFRKSTEKLFVQFIQLPNMVRSQILLTVVFLILTQTLTVDGQLRSLKV